MSTATKTATRLLTLFAALLLACGGCGDGDAGPAAAPPSSTPAQAPREAGAITAAPTDGASPTPTVTGPAATAATTAAGPAATRPGGEVRVVFLGDSITAGLGLEASQAFPALVGRHLEAEGLPVRVVNAGVSGDTTAGGVRRLDWLLRQSPDVLVVGLGGNDGLRGLDPKASEDNLRAIVRRAREAGASVLVLGMLIPPNYGPEYTRQFREIYPRLARELDVPLVPFVLEGVGGVAELNQPDGIHPTTEGHRIVAANVLPHLRDVLRALPARRDGAAAAAAPVVSP